MERVFTEYIRSLNPGSGPPEAGLFTAVWEKLRSALVAELRRRGLWNAPPGYLGIQAATTWADDDALDELLADCYTFILGRLPSLRIQLEVKDNVEGLVFRCIRNFLHDTQKKHDPVGFKVFTTLQTTIRRLTGSGTLHLLAGNPKVSNDTVLGFVAGKEPNQAADADLDAHVRGWSDELLPDLVTARGRDLERIEKRLADLISRLRSRGVEAFRVKGLVDPLKRDVRSSWNAIWIDHEGETGLEGDEEFVAVVRLVRPDSHAERREAFAMLLICVSEALERADANEKTRGYLRTLWLFLRNHATQGEPEKPPSQRRIAERLGIPRERLPGLYACLGPWIRQCQAATSGKR